MKPSDKVFYFMAGHGRGMAFLSSDLVHRFTGKGAYHGESER